MKFKLVIDCSNSAFENNPELEVARILEKLGGRLKNLGWQREAAIPLRDENGNSVGSALFTNKAGGAL